MSDIDQERIIYILQQLVTQIISLIGNRHLTLDEAYLAGFNFVNDIMSRSRPGSARVATATVATMTSAAAKKAASAAKTKSPKSKSAAAATAAAGPKKRTKSDHPTWAEMITTAVADLKDSPRTGSSVQSIKKYLVEHYKIDGTTAGPFMKRGLQSAIAGNQLVQVKGKGLSGSFKLAPGIKQKSAPVARAKKAASPKKKDVAAVPAKVAKMYATHGAPVYDVAPTKKTASKKKAAPKKPKAKAPPKSKSKRTAQKSKSGKAKK